MKTHSPKSFERQIGFTLIKLLVLIAISVGMVLRTVAQPAYVLDPGFKPVITQAGGWVNILTVQKDGKVYVAGGFDAIDGVLRPGLGRFDSTGRLDESFSPELFSERESVEVSIVTTVAIQSDGKVIVGAVNNYSYRGGEVVRLQPDGRRDVEFQSVFQVAGQPRSITLQTDGKILVVDEINHATETASAVVSRLNTSGSLDTTFSQVTLTGSGAPLIGLAVQADGRVVVWGCFTNINGTRYSGLARLNSDGGVDDSFRHDLRPALQAASEFCIYTAVLLQDGKLMVGGLFSIGRLVRLNPDGSLDSSFDPRASGGDLQPGPMLVQPDGKPIAQAYGNGYRLVRLNTDGGLDNTFNSSSTTGLWEILAMERDGGIVGLSFHDGSGASREIRKLKADGSTEASFVSASIGVSSEVGGAVQQLDGKWVIAGRFDRVNGVPRPGLVRLKTDGNVDESFSPSAPMVPSACGKFSCYNGLRVQSGDGKVIISGVYRENETGVPMPTLMRLNPDGSRDTGFDAHIVDAVSSLEITTDGRIIVLTWPRDVDSYRLVRLNSDGSLDQSFASHSPLVYISTIAVQKDGRLLTGGFSKNADGTFPPRLVRLLTDGNLDPTFTPPPFPELGSFELSNVKAQPDGRLLVISASGLMRLNRDGTSDATFGQSLMPGFVSTEGGSIRASLLSENRIIAFGNIHAIDAESVAGNLEWTAFAFLDANGRPDRAFHQWNSSGGNCGGMINDVVPASDGSLIITGCFTELNSQRRFGLARLRPAPVIRSVELNTDGSCSLSIGGEAGWKYRIESSTDLANWMLLREVPSQGAVTEFKDAGTATTPRRFYRTVLK